MRIKLGQDLATGLLFAIIGIGALIIGKDYAMGQWTRPGTGVLPAMLSGLLTLVGGILIVKSFTAGDSEITGINWKPLILVTLSVIAFGLFVDDTVLNLYFFSFKLPGLGLVIAMIISMTLCAYAIDETQWTEYFYFLAGMILLAWVMFICALGMPVNACPSFAQCELCWLVKGPARGIYSLIEWVIR